MYEGGYMTQNHSEENMLPIGVSRCLLGDEVRYDGGHKRNRYMTDVLGDYFSWQPVCPEVEAGLGTPRPAIRLVQTEVGLRVLGKDDLDVTDNLDVVADTRIPALRTAKIRGFIFKKDSPSCGMERVRLYSNGGVSRGGVGVFAARIAEEWPNLPTEEEGRLNDKRLRENFIERVFTYDRWRRFVEDRPSTSGLMTFHAQHKYLLLAHNQAECRRLGKFIAQAHNHDLKETLETYESRMMQLMRKLTTVKKQINTLQHLLGFVKNDLSRQDKADFLSVLEQYRNGIVPLITPLILLRFHLNKGNSEWAKAQIYLTPYPEQLALRSHL
jgi:uncharacterized protein YbgA (DUF1722 family)/uncharacterized protein YbbK (DUF523 family)